MHVALLTCDGPKKTQQEQRADGNGLIGDDTSGGARLG